MVWALPYGKLHHLLQIILRNKHIYAVIYYVIFNMGLDNLIRSLFSSLVVQFYALDMGVLIPVSIHSLPAFFG